MTGVKKTQLNSDDTKVVLESGEIFLRKGMIDEMQAEKASVKVGQTAYEEILRTESANLERNFAGEKKHKCERVENLSAKKTSKRETDTRKSQCISQTENEFEICGGRKIEDCQSRKMRKKLKVQSKSILRCLAVKSQSVMKVSPKLKMRLYILAKII